MFSLATRPVRPLWVAFQLLIIFPFIFAAVITAEMTFALPGGAYLSETHQLVRCEALALQGRLYPKPYCASFGSKETNPGGYAIAIAALAGLGTLLWWSSRPGRGLRLS